MADHLDAIHIKLYIGYLSFTLFLVSKIYCDIDYVGYTDCDIAPFISPAETL